jgi:hypothetical protein
VRDHPRHLNDVAQLDLSPRAARGRALQRGHEVAGLLAQRADAVAELADHLSELALRLAALALEAPDLLLHPAELLLDGLDDALHLLRATRHLARGALLLHAARLGDALGQRLAGLGEHVDRDRRQLLARTRAIAPRQGRRARGPEQCSEDQQQDAHQPMKDASRLGRERSVGRATCSLRRDCGPKPPANGPPAR